MDAHTPFKPIALAFSTILLVAAAANGQQIAANPTSVAFSSTGSVSVDLTSGTPVTFTVSKASTGDQGFYSVSTTANTTPATLTVAPLRTTCSPAPCSGSIIVHPTSGTGTDLTIPVGFGNGGGGGTSTIVFGSSNVSVSVASKGNSTSGSTTIKTSNGLALNNCSVTSSQTWLTPFLNSININGTAQDLSFFASSGSLGANSTNTGQITVTCSGNLANSFTVTFTVGSGGSGGGGNSTYTVSPSTVNLDDTNTTFVNVNVGNNAGRTTYRAEVTAGTDWLLIAPQGAYYSTSYTAPLGTMTIYGNNVGALNDGTYNGQIKISDPNNSSDALTIPIVLTVGSGSSGTNFSASPSMVSFSADTSDTTAQTQQVTINNAPSGFFSYSVSPAVSWLSISPVCTQNNCGTGTVLTLTAAPSGLTAGTYNTTVTFTSGSTTLQLPVSLAVTTNGTGGTAGLAAPASLSFAYQIATPALPAPPVQSLIVGVQGAFTTSTTVSTSQKWLKAGGTSGTANGTGPTVVQVTVDPTGLTAGTYTGSVTVATDTASQNVGVKLVVSSSPVIQSSPGSIWRFYTAGTGFDVESLTLVASDGSGQQVTLSSPASWITVSNTASTTTPANYTISLDPTALCNGLNSSVLNLSAPGAANTTDTIPIALLVSGSSNTTNCQSSTGILTLSPGTLAFSATQGGSAPATQTLAVSTANSTTFTVSLNTTSGNWLSGTANGAAITNGMSLSTPGNNGATNLVITASPSGLSAGTYNGNIALTAGGVTQNVPVKLTVSTGGTVTASPTSVTFNAAGSQDVNITGPSGTAPVSFTVNTTTTSGNNWLTVTNGSTAVANGTQLATPVKLTLNASATGLTPGTSYTGKVTLTPTGGGTPVVVNVTFNVAALPAVSASPTSLSFTYRAGDNPPPDQTINVSGGSGLTFSAVASSSGNWLSVSPAASTTPLPVTVSIKPGDLAPGTYNGTVTVAGTGSATGSTTVNVTLTVLPPLPTITQLSSAASYAGGSISPGEIIAIFGTSLGPTPAVTSPKVENGLVATTLGNVQVLVNGFPAPVLYAGNTQVTAVVPYEVRGLSATVVVRFLGQSSNGVSALVVPTAPGIFTSNSSGTGPAAVLNQNQGYNAPNTPESRGNIVSIYLTGEGQTSPAGVTGKVTTVASSAPLTPQPLLKVGVLIDNQPADITFIGEAPNLVSGLLQINVRIPPNVHTGEVPLVVNIGGNSSQQGVTLSVK